MLALYHQPSPEAWTDFFISPEFPQGTTTIDICSLGFADKGQWPADRALRLPLGDRGPSCRRFASQRNNGLMFLTISFKVYHDIFKVVSFGTKPAKTIIPHTPGVRDEVARRGQAQRGREAQWKSPTQF
jgi:hypothetical protein